MKSPLINRQFCAWVLAFLLVTGVSCRMAESDGDILTEISNRMHADGSMDQINASVAHGVVTLTGTCADEPCRQHAVRVVEDIDGVKEVVNNITLAPRDSVGP